MKIPCNRNKVGHAHYTCMCIAAIRAVGSKFRVVRHAGPSVGTNLEAVVSFPRGRA